MGGVYSVSTSEQDKRRMYISAPNYLATDEPKFPNVPIAPGVDLAALTAGDLDPKFITRPLAILDEVSDNGLTYNQAIFDDVYNQILTRRPVARQGHIAQEDKSSVFPPDAGYWIGAVIDSQVYGKPTVFGKAYLPPGPTRDLVLRRQATGTALSNSLWGDVTWAQDQDGKMEPLGVRIESVDFVPEERAALQALGGSFVVTSEMKGTEAMDDNDADDKKKVDEAAQFKQKCAEMTPEALHEMMTPDQRRHCAESYLKECDSKKVYEMLAEGQRSHIAEARMSEISVEETYKALSETARKGIVDAFCKETKSKLVPDEVHQIAEAAIAEMKTIKPQLTEMQDTIRGYEREKFERSVSEAIDRRFDHVIVRTDDGKKKIASLKTNLRMHVAAEMAGSTKIEDIEPATGRAYESEAFKPLAEMTLASLSGPAAVTGGVVAGGNNPFGWDPKTGRYSDEAVARAARQTGVLGGRSGGVK